MEINQQLNYTGVDFFLETGPLCSISPAFSFCKQLQKQRTVLYHINTYPESIAIKVYIEIDVYQKAESKESSSP